MTPPGNRTILATPPGPVQAAAPPAAGQAGAGGGPMWMRVLPALVTFGVMLWGITGSSYWRDESATLDAVHRPFGALLRMLGNVDAVHGAYYVIMWPLVRLAGSGEFAARLPSALAMTVAAGLLTALGRRLVSPVAGLAAGLIFAAVPSVSIYGQDARSYAMVTALATAASYLLMRAIAAPGRRRGWLAGYAACLAAVGVLNIFGVLLIPAHAITVACVCARRGDGTKRRRWLAVGWLAAATAAIAVVSPIILLSYGERSQLAWLVRPGPKAIATLGQLVGTGQMLPALGGALAGGLLASALAGRAALRVSWPPALLALAIPWLVIPPGLLLAAAQITPLYTLRYVMLSAPAGALLAGTAIAALSQAIGSALGWTTGTGAGSWARACLARVSPRFSSGPIGAASLTGTAIGWALCAAALVTIALLGAHAQVRARSPGGQGDNIRAADRIIAARMRPGDVAIYDTPSNENLQTAYSYGMARLPNIAQYQSPVPTGTLAGTVLPAAVVRQQIQGRPRLWVIEIHHDIRLPVLQGLGLRLLGRWQTADLWVMLYAQPRS